jgi:hypothetical protein
MKKLAMMVSLMALTGSVCLADAPAPATTAKPMGPCKQIMQACTQAGYEKGMHKKDGKGLYKDCLDPILAGTPVAGVTVDPAVVTSCQQNRAKHQQKKKAMSTAPTTPTAP